MGRFNDYCFVEGSNYLLFVHSGVAPGFFYAYDFAGETPTNRWQSSDAFNVGTVDFTAQGGLGGAYGLSWSWSESGNVGWSAAAELWGEDRAFAVVGKNGVKIFAVASDGNSSEILKNWTSPNQEIYSVALSNREFGFFVTGEVVPTKDVKIYVREATDEFVELKYYSFGIACDKVYIGIMKNTDVMLVKLEAFIEMYIFDILDEKMVVIQHHYVENFSRTISNDNLGRFVTCLDDVYYFSVCSTTADNNIETFQGCTPCLHSQYYGSGACHDCDPSCKSCSGPESTSCKSCTSPDLLYKGTCTKSCSDFGYAVGSNCYDCSTSCKTCSADSSKDCLSCSSATALYLGECIAECPVGFTDIQGICQMCDQNCNSCTGSISTCTTCNNNMYIEESSCVITCSPGYTLNNVKGSCEACIIGCTTCSIGSLNKCTVCKQDFFLYKSNCVSDCEISTYKDISQIECYDCLPQCLTCADASTCITCSPIGNTKFLYNNNCIDICPTNTFEKSGICISCHSDCETCTGDTETDCKSCSQESLKKIFYEGSCFESCPTDTFLDSKINHCKRCDSSCESCDGPSLSDCQSCHQDSSLKYLDNRICISKCPEGTFPLPSTNQCALCNSNCLTCSSENECLSCGASQSLYKSRCLDKPPVRAYYDQVAKEYFDCALTCITCASSQICLTCDNSSKLKFLLNGECLETCPEGTYADQTSKLCMKCHSTCRTCSDYKSCLSCGADTGFKYLFESTCLNSCPISTYLDIELNRCFYCPEHCLACDSPEHCLECNQNSGARYMFNNKCLSECPKRTYPSINSDECFECDNNIINDSIIPFECLVPCEGDKVLIEGRCEEKCPDGFVLVKQTCQNMNTTYILEFELTRDTSFIKENGYDELLQLKLIDAINDQLTPPDLGKYISLRNDSFSVTSGVLNITNVCLKRFDTFYLMLSYKGITESTRKIQIRLNEDLVFSIAGSISSTIILKNRTQEIEVIIPIYSQDELENTQAIAETGFRRSNDIATGMEVISVASSLSSIDPSGTLMKMSMNCKLISRLSFINIYYGSLLDSILIESGAAFAKSSNSDTDEVQRMERGFHGRFTKANISLQVISKLNYRIFLFFISWMLKLIIKRLFNKIKGEKGLARSLMLLIYYQRKIHFTALNMLIIDGIFLCSRSLFHGSPYNYDYFISFFTLTLILIDFYELTKNIEAPTKSWIDFNNSKKERFKAALKLAIKNRDEAQPDTSTVGLNSCMDDLPSKVPIQWMTKEEAQSFGYSIEEDSKHLKELILYDEAIFKFKNRSLNINTVPKTILGISTTNIETLAVFRTASLQLGVVALWRYPLVGIVSFCVIDVMYVIMIGLALSKGVFNSILEPIIRIVSTIIVLSFYVLSASILIINKQSPGKDIPSLIQKLGIIVIILAFIFEIVMGLVFSVIRSILWLSTKKIDKTIPITSTLFYNRRIQIFRAQPRRRGRREFQVGVSNQETRPHQARSRPLNQIGQSGNINREKTHKRMRSRRPPRIELG